MFNEFRTLAICGLLFCCAVLAGQVAEAAENVPYDKLANQAYVERGEDKLLADVYVPKEAGSYPGVLIVHGGAWVSGGKYQMNATARQLAAHGYTAVAIAYRLAPQHKFPAQIEDCKAAVRWMRSNAARYKIDSERIAAYGYSAGGHLVSLLGLTRPSDGLEGADAPANGPSTAVQAVVAGGAPCEFRGIPAESRVFEFFLGGSRKEKPELYRLASPTAFVAKDAPPFFFYHGEDDGMVPVAGAQQLRKGLQAAGVTAEWHTVPGSGHVAAFFDQTAKDKALEFLDRQFKPQPVAKPAGK